MNIDEYSNNLVSRYRSRGALLDANLCLLFLIGSIDINRIGKERGLKEFSEEDYWILSELLKKFKILYTTPNIVTEVSNLARAGNRERVPGATAALAQWVTLTNEAYVESRASVNDPSFLKLGITDSAIKILLSRGILLITADFLLAGYVKAHKLDVLNFNHLRYTE